MSFTLVASGQNSGTGGTVTVTSTVAIPAGTLIVAVASVAAGSLTFASVTDNAGIGNTYGFLRQMNAGLQETGVIALAIASGLTPSGTVWTFTLAAGTPGGRMASVGYFTDALAGSVAASVDINTQTASTTNSNTSGGTPAQAKELVLFACVMRSSTAGGINDSITLAGLLTTADNRNHTGTVNAYMAWGFRFINSLGAITDTAAFLAADSSTSGYVSLRLNVPVPPGNIGSRLLILKV